MFIFGNYRIFFFLSLLRKCSLSLSYALQHPGGEFLGRILIFSIPHWKHQCNCDHPLSLGTSWQVCHFGPLSIGTRPVKRSKQHHILHVSGSNLSKRLKVPFSRSWVPMSKAARTINNGASQYFLRLAVTHSSSPPIIDITDWTPHTEIQQRLIYWVEARWQKCAIASISCKCFTLTPLFRPTSFLIFAKSLKA